MGLFAYRLLGAAMLDAGMYEGIENDRRTTNQALAAVLLASLAAGIGAGDWLGSRASTMVLGAALAVITWAAWAMLIFQIGTRILPGPDTRADWGQLLRTTGFAAAPGLLLVFGLVPQARGLVFGVTGVWMFVAMVCGVRHALDYRSTGRALAVCALATLLVLAVATGLSMFLVRPVS
ncbi:MAG: YIP1 family protein [Acidobacteria bacterium]|nr:YIP1 family protein [Acidobacteriota bacterium]